MQNNLSLVAILIGTLYFSYFVIRLVQQCLSAKMCIWMKIAIVIIIFIISLPARNMLSLYAIIYYHLLVITIVLELVYLVMKKYAIYQKVFTTGILSIVITTLFLGFGYYRMKNVVMKTYQLTSDKIETIEVLVVSDLHMSTSMNVEELKNYCKEMSNLDADYVFLVGDIFDENTSYEAMKQASKELSGIANTKGIYYVFGNHDSASYSKNPPFNAQDVIQQLEENDIKVLDDEVVNDGKVTIIGRKDAHFNGDNPRLTMEQLLTDVDKQQYIIVLDHQPLELDSNAKLGVDLQISGHTHGGQMFPSGLFESFFTGKHVYGQETIGDFNAITTSGIAGWGYPIKTGANSEYVLISIE